MKLHITISLILCTILSCFSCTKSDVGKTPVDYVNPYLGNISHILVPTYPTVHLPNSMLRIYPLFVQEKQDNMVHNIKLIVICNFMIVQIII